MKKGRKTALWIMAYRYTISQNEMTPLMRRKALEALLDDYKKDEISKNIVTLDIAYDINMKLMGDALAKVMMKRIADTTRPGQERRSDSDPQNRQGDETSAHRE